MANNPRMTVFLMGLPDTCMAAVAHGVIGKTRMFVTGANTIADMYHQILTEEVFGRSGSSRADRDEVGARPRQNIRAAAMRWLRDKGGPFIASTILVYGFPESVSEARLFLASGDDHPALVIQLLMSEDEVLSNLSKYLEREAADICARAWKTRIPDFRSVLSSSVEGVAFATVNMEGRSIKDVCSEIVRLIEAHRQKLIGEGR